VTSSKERVCAARRATSSSRQPGSPETVINAIMQASRRDSAGRLTSHAHDTPGMSLPSRGGLGQAARRLPITALGRLGAPSIPGSKGRALRSRPNFRYSLRTTKNPAARCRHDEQPGGAHRLAALEQTQGGHGRQVLHGGEANEEERALVPEEVDEALLLARGHPPRQPAARLNQPLLQADQRLAADRGAASMCPKEPKRSPAWAMKLSRERQVEDKRLPRRLLAVESMVARMRKRESCPSLLRQPFSEANNFQQPHKLLCRARFSSGYISKGLQGKRVSMIVCYLLLTSYYTFCLLRGICG
jgi:hypothetical protein